VNPKDLLEKAKFSQLTPAEVTWVADALRNGDTGSDPYTLIHVLGRANARDQERLIADFLEASDDPMLVRIALQVLGSFWGMTAKYFPQVLKFAGGEEWDEDGAVRLLALELLGEHCATQLVPEALAVLLDAYTDPSSERAIRDASYLALARASGRAPKDLPSAARPIPPDQIDQTVLDWAFVHSASASRPLRTPRN
jgi:hypothetical protein